MRHQVPKQFEFLRREMYVLSASAHGAAFEIDTQILRGNRRERVGRRRAAKRRANACQQFFHSERLRNVIIGAGIERTHFVFFRAAHGQNDDRDTRAGAYFAAGLEAVHSRHIHIENDEIRPLAAHRRESHLAVFSFENRVALRGKRGAHHAPDLRFVIDHENR